MLKASRSPTPELDKVRRYLINPVESREAGLDKPEPPWSATTPRPADHVPVIEGFTATGRAGLAGLLDQLRPGHGPGRPDLPPGLLPGRGAAGTPPSPRCGWWTPTGLTTAATPPSPPIWTGWRSATPR
ncbi:MAG: hypothetical protein ACLRWQ_16830 [Flavonifractor plautii]